MATAAGAFSRRSIAPAKGSPALYSGTLLSAGCAERGREGFSDNRKQGGTLAGETPAAPAKL